MVFLVQSSHQKTKHQTAIRGFSSVKKSEVATVRNKNYDNRFYVFFYIRDIVHHEYVPQRQTVNQDFYISTLRHVRYT